jgi:hypothetical protein
MSNYSQYMEIIFPATGDLSAWTFLENILLAWTTSVGEEIFWLFVLPLPIMGYWIKTKSTELPVLIYLILGGIFYPIAPDIMQTPARIMLMFGIAGMLYHFFKNRG